MGILLRQRRAAICLSVCFFLSCDLLSADELSYRILSTKSHPTQPFTQGLIVDGGDLVETSGLYGQSYILRYKAQSGEVKQLSRLPDQYFAEGVTAVGDVLYLLTWREGQLLRLQKNTFEPIDVLPYQGEGWGITYDGQSLITSDGSAKLSFRDPKTFAILRQIDVHQESRKWMMLNELEFAENIIWANVWMSPIILAINPTNGQVINQLNLAGLVKQNQNDPQSDVLNGIAYDGEKKAFWVTGKNWPNRYLIKLNWPATKQEGNTKDAPAAGAVKSSGGA